MRLLAQILLTISIIFLIDGCCPKCPEPNIVYVPQKCIVPAVDEPVIDNTKYDDNAAIVRKVLSNYARMKEYAENLKINSEACK